MFITVWFRSCDRKPFGTLSQQLLSTMCFSPLQDPPWGCGRWDTGWVDFDGHRVRTEGCLGLWDAHPESEMGKVESGHDPTHAQPCPPLRRHLSDIQCVEDCLPFKCLAPFLMGRNYSHSMTGPWSTVNSFSLMHVLGTQPHCLKQPHGSGHSRRMPPSALPSFLSAPLPESPLSLC